MVEETPRHPDDIEKLLREAEQPQRQARLDEAATEVKVLREADSEETDLMADKLIAESTPPVRQLKKEVEAMESESPVRMPGFNDRR